MSKRIPRTPLPKIALAVQVEIDGSTPEAELAAVPGFAGIVRRDGKMYATFPSDTPKDVAADRVARFARADDSGDSGP